MIRITDLTVRFENTTALDTFSFDFSEGMLYGIIGRNGAGKSTLLRGMTGLVADYEGTVLFDDNRLDKQRHEIKKMISYVPEEAVLLPYMTGREYLELISVFRKLVDATVEIEDLLTNFGLTEFQNKLTIDYSHGMQKKLSLAAALLGNQKYILIDEGLNGLDPNGLAYVIEKLKAMTGSGRTVVFASHDIELVSDICTHVLVLHEGRLIKDYPEKEIEIVRNQKDDSLRKRFINLMKDSADHKRPDHPE